MNNTIVSPESPGAGVDAVGGRVRGGKGRLGPVHYSRGTILDFEEGICAWLSGERGKNFIVGYVNPHVFNIAWENEAVRRFLGECDIVAVDGLGVAVAVSMSMRRVQTRTVMTPLFDRVVANLGLAPENAILIGGNEVVAKKGSEEINAAGRAIRVTVTMTGYEPLERYLEAIEAHPECDVILVAMGSPRSEELIAAANERFRGKLLWNIGGGTLHFYAGTQARTPHFLSAIGLQWLWRIVHEPSIAPRYVFGIPLYVWRLGQTMIGRNSKQQAYGNSHCESGAAVRS